MGHKTRRVLGLSGSRSCGSDILTTMVPMRRAGVLAVTAVSGVILVVWILTLAVDPAGEGASGTGFDYRGDFYALSGAEVRPERLGDVIEQDWPFQDSTVEVRVITGIDVDTAVAALLSDAPGAPSQDRAAWLLLSPDPDLAADPWSYPYLAAALKPPP